MFALIAVLSSTHAARTAGRSSNARSKLRIGGDGTRGSVAPIRAAAGERADGRAEAPAIRAPPECELEHSERRVVVRLAVRLEVRRPMQLLAAGPDDELTHAACEVAPAERV